MKPVYQDKFGVGGNCFAACLASLFEIPLDSMPDFCERGVDEEWWASVREWLAQRGYGIMTVTCVDIGWLEQYDGWMIVSGKSDRDLNHATLWRRGTMRHDPHPSGTGLAKPEFVDLLYPLDPHALVARAALKKEREEALQWVLDRTTSIGDDELSGHMYTTQYKNGYNARARSLRAIIGSELQRQGDGYGHGNR